MRGENLVGLVESFGSGDGLIVERSDSNAQNWDKR
jgi:hypothetical protein